MIHEFVRMCESVGMAQSVCVLPPAEEVIGEIAADAAVAASIAFQFGAPLETVRHALADRLAGPSGAALALIAATAASKQERHNG